MWPAGATTDHPTTMATRPDVMHPRNQPQRLRKPGGRVSEAVTSAGSVVTIPASVRESRASTFALLAPNGRKQVTSVISEDQKGRKMGKVIVQASMSLDGFIADSNDQVGPLFDWYSN